MKFDLKKFETQLPPFFYSLLDELFNEGFTPTIVGGAIRDLFLTGSLGVDWDIELTHETISFNKHHWKDMGKTLSRYGKVSFLPYDIIRIDSGTIQIEFSPPRIEHYREESNSHSNFDAEFDFKLPFSESVQRRDFSINAMGIRFHSKKKLEFLDPLDGLIHLREKILHFAGRDFSRDPVRYIRAHRFSQIFGFSFSPELYECMKVMNLEGLTSSYVWSEMQKSKDPVSLLAKLIQEKAIHPELNLPLDEKFLVRIAEFKRVLSDPKKHETWIMALEWVDISSERWTDFFSLSSDTARRLGRWANSSKTFQLTFPEAFHGEFEKIRDEGDFEELFNWYFSTKQLLQKYPDLPLLKMIEDYLPDWIHLFKFEPPKDVKHIDPPYRAKYQLWNICQRL